MWACQKPRSTPRTPPPWWCGRVRVVRPCRCAGGGGGAWRPTSRAAPGRPSSRGRRRRTSPTMFVSNERWTNSRWKPTVIPRAVRTYMPSRRPRSVQRKPQPQTKKGAATTPSRGTMMATQDRQPHRQRDPLRGLITGPATRRRDRRPATRSIRSCRAARSWGSSFRVRSRRVKSISRRPHIGMIRRDVSQKSSQTGVRSAQLSLPRDLPAIERHPRLAQEN